jgi:hypothetical protein
VPRPSDKNVIGSKWVFKNKLNEQGQIVRNKARLVCKDMLRLKDKTLMKHLLQWQEWRL